MILVVDNYDSFVHNLARYVREIGFDCLVRRNDAITIADIHELKPSHIIISPGPCAPLQAGISMEVVREFASSIPILGVCLGHQVIGQVFGAAIVRAKYPMHGKASLITHQGEGIFKGLTQPLRAGRYHSLIVSEENFPEDLMITARCPLGEIMGVQHKVFPVIGVQFHPESVLTEEGIELLSNFVGCV